MVDNSKLSCTFCAKSASKVKKLIAGPDVFICNECVGKCHEILTEKQTVAPASTPSKDDDAAATPDETKPTYQGKVIKTPREIKDFLDQYVIGQDFAKEALSVAVYNHYKRLANPTVDGVEIDKSNILMCGPTGVGKTLLAQTIARLLDVPFAIADATSLTEAGYVGEDVESVVGRLLGAANNDVGRAEKGIIFLDEIDKKRTGGGGTNSRDVSGEGVQQALLKLLEGSEVMVAPAGVKKTPATELVKVNTRNILFIVGGAFVGLDKLVEKSMAKDESGVGFAATNVIKKKHAVADLLARIEPEHLVQFGLIPELIGRLPVIAALTDLDEAQLVQVMTEPKNALAKQSQALFRLDGIELEFEAEALTAIAVLAKKRKTNGRALRSVLETRLMRTQFDLPDLRLQGVIKVIVEAATINDRAAPRYVYAEPAAEAVEAAVDQPDAVENKPAA